MTSRADACLINVKDRNNFVCLSSKATFVELLAIYRTVAEYISIVNGGTLLLVMHVSAIFFFSAESPRRINFPTYYNGMLIRGDVYRLNNVNTACNRR